MYPPCSARVQSAVSAALLLMSSLAFGAPFGTGTRYPLLTDDADTRGAFRVSLRVIDDLNSDGRRDLAVKLPHVPVQVLLSGPSRTFASRSVGNATAVSALTSGDFTGDGKIDLAVSDEASFAVLAGDGFGNFTALPKTDLDVLGPHASVEDLVSGNFDTDNRLDLVVIDADPLNNFRSYPGSSGPIFYRNSIAVAYGRGDGSFDMSRPRVGVNAYPQRLAAVNFQDDGRPELLIVGAESKTLQIATNSATSPLGTQYGTVFLHAASDQADIIDVAAAELDNSDSKLDLAVLFYAHTPDANGRRYFLNTYRNTATGTPPFGYANALTALAFDAAPGAVALANVSGDASVDAIVSTRRDDWPGVTVYPGNGAGGFGAADVLPERFAGEGLVAADFDNDGKVDIAVVDQTSHAVVVYWHQ